MEIFTDASLNSTQKVAGVGMVFVPNREQQSDVMRLNTHFMTDNIETAELFAIAAALGKLHPENTGEIRIVTDSLPALRKIQNIFQYPSPDRIHHVEDLMQKKIMYYLSSSFEKIKGGIFSFHLIRGHQRKVQMFSDGYYNAIADEEARVGRIEGENAKLNEIRLGISPARLPSAEENIVLNQPEVPIFSPKVSFCLEGLPPTVVSSKTHGEKGFTRKVVRTKQGRRR